MIGILVLALAFIFRGRRTEIPVTPKQENIQKMDDDQTAEIVEKPNQAGSSTFNTNFSNSASDAPSTKPAKILSGLCKNADRKNNLFPLSLYLHLVTKKPDYFLLPEFHAHCLPSFGNIQYRLVNFDSGSDSAYDYWGDFNMSARIVKKVSTIKELDSISEFKLSGLGYENTTIAIQEFSKIGGKLNEPFYLFQLEKIENAKPRSPIGDYNYYPGIKIITAQDLLLPEYKERTTLVDLRLNRPSNISIANAAQVKNIPQLRSLSLLVPNYIESIYENNKDKIPKLPTESTLVLIGPRGGSKVPFNWVPFFKKSPVKNIAILKDGYLSLVNRQSITPPSYYNLNSLAILNFQTTMKDAILIDTRSGAYALGVGLESAWHSPVVLDQDTDYSDLNNRKTVDVSKIDFEQIVKSVGKKKLILIGENEYDWSPLILSDHLSKSSIKSIYWLREGFEGLWVYKNLNLIPNDLNSKIINASGFKLKNEQKVIETLVKDKGVRKGKFVLIQRVANSRKSFVKRNYRKNRLNQLGMKSPNSSTIQPTIKK